MMGNDVTLYEHVDVNQEHEQLTGKNEFGTTWNIHGRYGTMWETDMILYMQVRVINGKLGTVMEHACR